MRYLDETAAELMKTAKHQGMVCIVTNALNGWIQESCQQFLPHLYKEIEKQQVGILSARSRYESEHKDQNSLWKILAFQDIAAKVMDEKLITNLVIIGDSDIEIDAGFVMTQSFTQAACFLKTVKLIDSPKTPDDLSKQLKQVNDQLEQFSAMASNQSIEMRKFNRTFAKMKTDMKAEQVKEKAQDIIS